MKKLLYLLILIPLLFALSSDAKTTLITSVGGGAAAPACATDTVDQSNASGTSTVNTSTNAVGQSFQVSKNGYISAIDILCLGGGDGDSITVRWGTTADLSTSYIAEASLTNTVETSFNKLTFVTKGAVSSGTTYYLAVIETAGTFSTRKSSTDVYASGSYYYATTGWNMVNNTATEDLQFKVYLCD